MRLHVYGWTHEGRYRAIMLTRSRAAVCRELDRLGYSASDGWLRDYGCETGNEREIAAATAAGEGVILVADSQGPVTAESYKPLPSVTTRRS